MTATLILIRGLPGSGKSTQAKALRNFQHFEADMYFHRDGKYRYDAKKIKNAHDWCQRETFNALSSGENVVVSNTFTRIYEMQPYFDICKSLGVSLQIIEANGKWPNVHNVPPSVVDRMRIRWEPFVDSIAQ